MEEIYGYLVQNGAFQEESLWQIMEKEKDLELRFCQARKSVVQLYQFAINQGKRVVAISDMYLSSTFIGEIFQRNEIPAPERIFVSCEAGLTKRNGHLFEYAVKELGIRKDALVHIGDNPKCDVRAARKLGIRAFPYSRPVSVLKGKEFTRSGYTYRRAYDGIASSTGGYNSIQNLGIRCMLAVAANRLYDDPYRLDVYRKNSYADNPELFGTEALGMYCMAHTLWIDRIRKKENNDSILFFSRDGYLFSRAYEKLQEYRSEQIKASYVQTSRKARLPLLMSDRKLMLSAGTYLDFRIHSPRSLTDKLQAVLDKQSVRRLKEEYSERWEAAFPSETAMLQFLEALYNSCTDAKKAREYREGFIRYFTPFMGSSVLTYDVGYHLGMECLLKHLFPKKTLTLAAPTWKLVILDFSEAFWEISIFILSIRKSLMCHTR